MRIWVDVYNPITGQREGDGQIESVTSLSVTRALDGAGSVQFNVPATDIRALQLLENEVRVRCWVEHEGDKRELGRGVIRSLSQNIGDGGASRQASGPDSLDDLTRYVVGRNRNYVNEAVGEVAQDLVSLVPGWNVTAQENLGLVDARYSGVNVLKALIRLVGEKGCHLREYTTANVLEIGAFGDQNTKVMVLGIDTPTREAHKNKEIMFIDRLNETHKTDAVYNTIIPLGAGQGEAALTLKNSTRTGGLYAIKQRTLAGRVEYYLRDEASYQKYGTIEQYIVFDEIAPITNTTSAKVAAANADRKSVV